MTRTKKKIDKAKKEEKKHIGRLTVFVTFAIVLSNFWKIQVGCFSVWLRPRSTQFHDRHQYQRLPRCHTLHGWYHHFLDPNCDAYSNGNWAIYSHCSRQWGGNHFDHKAQTDVLFYFCFSLYAAACIGCHRFPSGQMVPRFWNICKFDFIVNPIEPKPRTPDKTKKLREIFMKLSLSLGVLNYFVTSQLSSDCIFAKLI